jgi:CRISPR-associated protein Cas1
MKTLYISQQGCYLCLAQELMLVKFKGNIINQVQIPLLEQILIFGKSQITTQAIRACLWRDIPIVYLSKMGYCYGRILSIEKGYRQLSRYQQQINYIERLQVAKTIVKAKLHNSKIILQRQQRRIPSAEFQQNIQSLTYLIEKTIESPNIEKLMGYEGAGAAAYFSILGECFTNSEFTFYKRSKRPPGNEINALLSFGYQVLWNHLLALVEVQGLDPYFGFLHESSERHAALVSDLIEEFRAPIVDSLVLYLINKNIMKVKEDFEFRDGGCYLNEIGRKKYLSYFVQRMEETMANDQPRWDSLMTQVKNIKRFVYNPIDGYQPYLIQ